MKATCEISSYKFRLSFLFYYWHTFSLEPNMVYLNENIKALIKTYF